LTKRDLALERRLMDRSSLFGFALLTLSTLSGCAAMMDEPAGKTTTAADVKSREKEKTEAFIAALADNLEKDKAAKPAAPAAASSDTKPDTKTHPETAAASATSADAKPAPEEKQDRKSGKNGKASKASKSKASSGKKKGR
jgi:hypothetical protein